MDCIVLEADAERLRLFLGVQGPVPSCEELPVLDLRIGHIGLLNFGALDDFGLTGRLEPITSVSSVHGWQVHSFFASQSPLARKLLLWYIDDWMVSTASRGIGAIRPVEGVQRSRQ